MVSETMLDKTPQDRSRLASWSAVVGLSDFIAGRLSNLVLLVGRLAMGFIFFQSGAAKLGALSVFSASLSNRGVPFPGFWGPVGAISEFVGGAAIILGLGTRWAALLIIIFVMAATGIAHRYWEIVEPAARRLQEGQFYKNLAIIGGALFLFVCGAGRFSLDALFTKRK